MQLLKALWALAGAALCCFLVLVIHAQFLKEGQLAAGTCEIVTLDRDSSQPRRTIARQTARCACRKGQIAGTTRARPACVDARIVRTKQWCDMLPCLDGEGCDLLINRSGWTCTQPGGRVKTTTPRSSARRGHRLPSAIRPPSVSLARQGQPASSTARAESVRPPPGLRPGTRRRAALPGTPGAWPGRPPGLDLEKEEDEEDETEAPSAREWRTAPGPGRTESRTQMWPLLEPQTVRIAFIFLSFQYIQ
uniref:Uncharacterized protein n=1 Tax=Rangifer tarandus platyrhynchus TaxID=3082113 RepID=A0ACB0DZC7_RANTA|nr:unnamed protein product [Rangifer tarandus platyrhynchus]